MGTEELASCAKQERTGGSAGLPVSLAWPRKAAPFLHLDSQTGYVGVRGLPRRNGTPASPIDPGKAVVGGAVGQDDPGSCRFVLRGTASRPHQTLHPGVGMSWDSVPEWALCFS